MSKFGMLAVAVLVGGAARADDAAKSAAPGKEHAWLKQLEGEWEFTGEGKMAPDQPAFKCKGTETVRTLGGFWIVSDMKSEMMGMPMTGQMTVGYDAARKKYVGTWVCSMCDWMCQYEGSVDAAGKVLTLNCEGPSPTDPAKKVKMKDVLEVKDADTRVMTSHMQGDDGKWAQFMTLTAKRKK